MQGNGWDYKQIKATAKDHGVKINDLIALAPKNDPFYCGTDADIKKAQWFMEVWNRCGFTSGVHLRRVHYRLVSDPDAVKYDGKPYENTELDWSHLCEAGCKARYLGLIDPRRFEDRRNPDPVIRGGAYFWDDPDHDFPLDAWKDWAVPSIETDLTGRLNLNLPKPIIMGYEYEAENDQPYHLEVWVEKTTLEGDLWDVCNEMDITYLAGPGFQSVTRIVEMLIRVKDYNKPTVIFYISDFDPAGDVMPVAVARQIEFWRNKLNVRLDVKLNPIVLTRQQVIDYRLPRTPIKVSDLRKSGFEDRHGEGAVELDALEALYPGEIATILKEAAGSYRDESLPDRLWDAKKEAKESAESAWKDKVGHYKPELDQLQTQANEVIGKYNERLTTLSSELDTELQPIKERIEDIRQAVSDEMYTFYPPLVDRPDPEIDPPDQRFLFDSQRDYLTQLIEYQRHKSGN